MTGLATSSLDVGRADAGSFADGVGKLSWYSFRLITGLQDLGGVAASQMAESNQAGPRQCFLGFPLLLLWEVAERCEKEDIHEANRLRAGQSVCRAPVHGLRPQRRREAFPAGRRAKDDALKLRQQLAQAKSGADAENVRQQIMKVLSDASLTVESIHFTEAELKDYVKAASAAEKPAPPPPKAKAVRHTKARRKG